MLPTVLWSLDHGERPILDEALPLLEAQRQVGEGAWELEIGFGKGRYLLDRAGRDPEVNFLGIEIASKYYRLARDRAARKSLGNLALLRAEALYLMATSLGKEWADAVHVYFPDPWPKDRHHKRRLFDPETVDLVLGLLKPGAQLFFASDFIEYGELVQQILEDHPGVDLEVVREPWPEGARTNYEAKFMREGLPIIRLIATRVATEPSQLLHPSGRLQLLAATDRMESVESPTS